MLNLLHKIGPAPRYDRGPTPWPVKSFHVVHVVKPINPHAQHKFRNTLNGNCASCSWPEWHQFHKLRGRRYPYKGARVRVLSVPPHALESPFTSGLKPGMEGDVIESSKWYESPDVLDGGNMVFVALDRGPAVVFAARQLLVLE